MGTGDTKDVFGLFMLSGALKVRDRRIRDLRAENKALTAENEALRARLETVEADRAAQAERIRELEEALTKRIEWHRCSCPEPCDDYGVFPGGCTGRYREDYHKLRAALGGNADA